MAKKLSSDKMLFTITVALVMFGLVMIYSASAVMAIEKHGSAFYYVFRQGIWFVLGLCALAIMMKIPYRKWNRKFYIYSFLIISVALLAGVLFMPAIASVHRWFRVGPMSIQPAELAKYPLILFLAYHLSRKQDRMESFWHTIFPALLVCGQLALLVVMEPDLGTAIMYVGITFGLLFLAGMPWRYFAVLVIAILPVFYFLVMNVDYRRERLFSFFNPEADALNSGFQIIQSLIALGTGGIYGAGLGDGFQKLFYLPEPHTDFIFAIVGEELGLLGTVGVLSAYIVLFWRGLRISWKAPDPFGQFLGMGITIMIVLQAFTNISVVIGILPTKGLPLPFVSSGGSSLLVNMIGIGTLLNISQHTQRFSWHAF